MVKRVSFKRFLLKLERTPEYGIRQVMGDEYIDTPGFYKEERKNYSSIYEFMKQNMGVNEYNKLRKWWKKNPEKVNALVRKH